MGGNVNEEGDRAVFAGGDGDGDGGEDNPATPDATSETTQSDEEVDEMNKGEQAAAAVVREEGTPVLRVTNTHAAQPAVAGAAAAAGPAAWSPAQDGFTR